MTKPSWRKGDLVTITQGSDIFTPGEELVVMGNPGEYVQLAGNVSTRIGATVLSKPEDADGRARHFWVDDYKITLLATPQEVDEAIQSILAVQRPPAPDYRLLYEATVRNIKRMARQSARVRMPAEIRALDAAQKEST